MSESFEFNAPAEAAFADSDTVLAPGEIVLGTFSAIDAQGNPLVSYLQSGYSQRVAVSALPALPQHIGRQVALLFVNGDIQKPIIMGFIHNALNDLLESFVAPDGEDTVVFENPVADTHVAYAKLENPNALHVDGKQVVISGEEEIVLRCGEASITLTKAGKIMIRGKYLVSRSSGINRILGGSVSVN